jgi:hypothetical protein
VTNSNFVVTGTIVDKMFKGGRQGLANSFHACFYSIEMEKQSRELAPTTFDGQYVGTGRPIYEGNNEGSCPTMKSADMTVVRGEVVIHLTWFDSTYRTFRGSINSAGEVSASRENDGMRLVTGIIVGKVFKGQRFRNSLRDCFYSIEMEKRSGEPARQEG